MKKHTLLLTVLLSASLTPFDARLRADVCRPAVSPHAGWPQFRGPARDGIVQSWPESGPGLLWQADRIGRGWSSPVIVEDTLYITGDVGEDCRIFAHALDGKRKWDIVNGRSWKKSYPGARASCTFYKGSLYHINAHGRAVCLDPKNGKERWAVNILETFGAPNIRWAISECLLVDGDEVIVTPGGPNTLMAALDRRSGEVLWKTEPLRFNRTHRFGGKEVDPPQPDTDKTGYASPLLFTIGGKRLVCSCSARHLFCVDPDEGKLVWTHPVYARYEVIGSMPAAWQDAIFFSAPDDFGGKLFRFAVRGDDVSITELWQAPLDSCHGSAVVVGNALYGSGHRQHRPWACIDLERGKVRYSKEDLQKGAVIHADNRIYALAENGVLALLEPTPNGFEVRGRIMLTDGSRKDAWAHPVILNGRLYLRYHDRLMCYDIRNSR